MAKRKPYLDELPAVRPMWAITYEDGKEYVVHAFSEAEARERGLAARMVVVRKFVTMTIVTAVRPIGHYDRSTNMVVFADGEPPAVVEENWNKR